MSALDESGVYYTPSVGFPNRHLDSQEIQHPAYPQDALKLCSVKGCTDTLSFSDPNRMCDACRSRHRIYASTKRARRKLEKAAITNAVVSHGRKDIQEISHVAQSISWVTSGGQFHQDLQLSNSNPPLLLSSWPHAIDPCLFSGNISPTSPHRLSPPRPHQTSTSSELANALTPRQPSTSVSVPASAILPTRTATDYRKHYRDHTMTQQQSSHLQGSSPQVPPQPHMSVASRCDDDDLNDNDEEQVIESLQVKALKDQQTSSETVESCQGKLSDEVDGSVRFCSVKGCKAVIPVSYEYKMCPPCRTRYRTYGNTKRAKWKAERDAFDREMASLRTMEDDKRKAKGLRPLAESPEELRAWELSVIDEQVPLVPIDNSTALCGTSLVAEPGLAKSLPHNAALINSPMVLARVYPPPNSSPSTVDPTHVISPYNHLNNNPLLAVVANTSLPARMCTVSHCHKILPGYYRYKRCEQHRLQNRHHSQLKRVREKEVKAVRPEEGATEIPLGMEAGGRADKEDDHEMKQPKAAPMADATDEGKEAGVPGGVHDNNDSERKNKSHDPKRSKFSCFSGTCHNLLLPTVRWRSCEPCRSIERQRKNQIKFEQKAASEKYYWSEKMNVDSQAAVVSENQATNGKAQQTNHAISAGAVDSDAEGDIDMGENADGTEPKAVENHQPVVPIAVPPPSIPPASMTGGFSRFHVTIDPRNASSSAALDPTTSTAKLVTLDDPLAFRAYRPKTTPSAIGRILARNPGLSVDAFTEVLAESESTGTMALPLRKEANATSTTKSIITPTIPTSPPFVYKAPEKKNVSTKSQDGAIGKDKRKAASSEKPSTANTTPTTPVAPTPGASASTVSVPPGSYGAYGYPHYPYPYPFYIPSPYGIPPFPYLQAPAPTPPDPKQKRSSKSSTSAPASASSSSPTPSTTIPAYSPYPYPYPPQPYAYPPPPGGYPYMSTRYIPGQPLHNGLPPGPSSSSPYPYLYYPPVPPAALPIPAPVPTLAPTSATAPFPKTAAAARERQRTQDTKFNYYHYGAGSSDSPTMPNNKKRKRLKVDPDYLEKYKAQTEAISMSLALNQARRETSSSVHTPPPASVASDISNVTPPIISAQPETAVDAGALSKPNTPRRLCASKTCHRSLPVDTANTLCDKCRQRFKKHQAKARKRFKLEPRKFVLSGRTVSEKQGSESIESKGSVELD